MNSKRTRRKSNNHIWTKPKKRRRRYHHQPEEEEGGEELVEEELEQENGYDSDAPMKLCNPFKRLPVWIVLEIFSYLDFSEQIGVLVAVCKGWR